jgi:hypothetical protein
VHRDRASGIAPTGFICCRAGMGNHTRNDREIATLAISERCLNNDAGTTIGVAHAFWRIL